MTDATSTIVLTVTELATRWRCTRKSVLEAIHSGRIHAFRIGKRAFRVALVEVERYERGRD